MPADADFPQLSSYVVGRNSQRPEQLDFFPGFRGQSWLPGETVFSWASRYHRLSGKVKAGKTAEQLFGRERSWFHTDLPAGIDRFVQVTDGQLGSSTSILFDHTILPYYLLFRPQNHTHDAIQAVRCGHLSDVRGRLGMPGNRLGPPSKLKACRICLELDQRNHGCSYWHISHQLPGVWVCPLHHMPLTHSRCSAPKDGRYRWLLPDINDLEPSEGELLAAMDSGKSALVALARMAVHATETAREFEFDACRLVATYLTALREHGFVETTGQPCSEELGAAFFEAMSPLHFVPEMLSISSDRHVAARQVSHLLRVQVHCVSFPNLVFIAWLFGSWDVFRAAYDRIDINDSDICLRVSGPLEKNNARTS